MLRISPRRVSTTFVVTPEMLKAGEQAYEASIRARLMSDDVQKVREDAMAAAYRAMRALEPI